MSAPPPAHERPSLASARRGDWRSFLLQEWGLLLLAAALAVLIWEITSRRVVTTRSLDNVEVRLEIDPSLEGRVGAVLERERPKLDFELFCSEREANEARAALDVDGRPVVVLRITQPPGGKRALNASLDHYAWPFADHARILVAEKVDVPPGEVFDLAPVSPRVAWGDEQRKTHPTKAELAERGIGVSVETSLHTVDLLAPAAQKDQPGWQLLQPDPIDLSTLVEAEDAIPFDEPQTFTLGFRAWRGGGNAAWRRGLSLPRIEATVTLTSLGSEPLRNRLIFQLPQEFKAKIDRNRIVGIAGAGQLTFEGTLRGPKAVLEALAKDPAGWAWGVEITDPANLPDGGMTNGEPSEPKTVNGRIFWYATRAEYRDKGITFEPEPGQDSFDVEVRYWKRGP